MIVDCYTHTWDAADQLGRCLPLVRSGGVVDADCAGPARHLAATEPVDVTLVLGFVSRYLESDLSNERVHAYVRQHPDRLIGFAGIDPSEPREAIEELHRARDEFGMPGLCVAPAAQDFHPTNSQAMTVYAEAAQRGMPILFHTGIHVTAGTKLEYARPILLDEIARELPELRIIIAHMGSPWVEDTLLLLSKHKNVYAEISRVLDRPWHAYQAFLSAYQSGVMDKLLFGSGFPASSASASIEALYSINHLCNSTSLPTIPREQLRGIVERDTLSLLGITSSVASRSPDPAAVGSEVDSDEEVH